MSSRLPVLCIVTTYLLVASLAVLMWLGTRGDELPTVWAALIGLGPAVLHLAIASPARGRSESLGRSTACLGFLPVLLLIWASSRADDLAHVLPAKTGMESGAHERGEAPESGRDLDSAQLFAGALSTQEAPLQHGVVASIRSAVFSDGSELRLYRFETGVHAGAYLNFLSGTLRGSPAKLANRVGTRLSPEEPRYVYVEQHGRELLQVDAEEAAKAQIRLETQSVPVPKPSVPGSTVAQTDVRGVTSEQATIGVAGPQWPFMLPACVVHALVFVGFIFWAGSHTTRVAPVTDVARVADSRLRARLISLQEAGVPFSVASAERADELVVEYRFAPESGRRHHVLLHVDGQHGRVRVRERTNTRGATPKDESERSMRTIGEPRFDPTRPDAQKLWGKVAQTSILEPEQLAAVPLSLREDRAELPPDYVQSIDTDRMIYVLCAVVTRSGFGWHPVFFG